MIFVKCLSRCIPCTPPNKFLIQKQNASFSKGTNTILRLIS